MFMPTLGCFAGFLFYTARRSPVPVPVLHSQALCKKGTQSNGPNQNHRSVRVRSDTPDDRRVGEEGSVSDEQKAAESS